MWCCSEVDHYPKSSKVGGVVAETPQETVWSVSFRAAVGAPVIQFIIPENAGKLVQRRPINHLKRQTAGDWVTCGHQPDLVSLWPASGHKHVRDSLQQ